MRRISNILNGFRNQTTAESIPRMYNPCFLGTLVLSFLLAIALNINRNVTIKLYRSLLNLNFLSLLYRESKEENFLIYYLLYGLYFIGISLFLYLSIIHFKGLREPVYILYITLFILTIYSIRHISLKVLGLIYGVYKEADRYLFSIVIFSCIMAIILIPADFVITFVSPAIAQKSIYIIISLFAFLYLYRQLREIIFSANIWREHIFIFIVSLHLRNCTPCLNVQISGKAGRVLNAEGNADQTDCHRCKKTNRYKKVKSILLSQPKPERSPYFELETKFNVTVDWRPFIQVEGYTEKEFRRQRIRHDEYPNVIFTSKSAIENYFRLAEEMRFKINEMNKYFCATEAIANYLQKFIIFRKGKFLMGPNRLLN